MITGINESKILTNVNADLMEKNVIQINCGITINVEISVKNVMYVKMFIFGILLYVVVKKKIFSKYYGWFNNYLWWNYRSRGYIERRRNKTYYNKLYGKTCNM